MPELPTLPARLQAFSDFGFAIAGFDHARKRSHVSASALASANVPVWYPRHADAASGQTTESPICKGFLIALFRTRTGDPLLTMEVLYQLS